MLNIRRHLTLGLLICAALAAHAQSKYDCGKPFGWACCTSLTSGDDYTVTGGNATENGAKPKTITLQANGKDMRDDIISAIEQNDIIVLDGSKGEFIVSHSMPLKELRNKTIIGKNHAVVSTQFKLTPEIHDLMNKNHVLDLPTSGTGELHVLPNGAKVKEDCEFAIRGLLIDYLHDKPERYRNAGLFQLAGCENVILRNITLVGPGAIDVGGDDLLTITRGTRHVWVDHCEFVDGMDGNFDINGYSDFISVTWTTFRYTVRTFVHANTNLVGSSDREQGNGEDNLNVTYAFCRWGEGCNQRMPMVRFGTIHLLNDYYDCANNSAAVNPRFHSEVLLDGCYFEKGVMNIFKEKDARSFQFRNCHYSEKFSQPADRGAVSIPYAYKTMPTSSVPKEVKKWAGATLK